MEDRKGFLTPNQEKGLDDLIQLKGVAEAIDGPAIRIADNNFLEKFKSKIPPEYIETVCSIIDEILGSLGIEK